MRTPAQVPALLDTAISPRDFRTGTENPQDRAKFPENIYGTLARHQSSEEWASREIVTMLLYWAAKFTLEFKLDIPEVAICVDDLSWRRYGHFRYGHNSFGLKGEIALNIRYLPPHRPLWEVLGTLLHELLHAWQQAHGNPGRRNHHNQEFRDKARELGLLIDPKGVTGYSAGGRFKDLLRVSGLEIPEMEILPVELPRERGRSKLRKWSCGCTNVRVGVTDFRALCLKCGRQFQNCQSSGEPVEANTNSEGLATRYTDRGRAAESGLRSNSR